VGHVEDVAADRRCHLRQFATDGVYAGAHAVIVWRVSRPLVADSASRWRLGDATDVSTRLPRAGFRLALICVEHNHELHVSALGPCRHAPRTMH
jgi:hypothetical protein